MCKSRPYSFHSPYIRPSVMNTNSDLLKVHVTGPFPVHRNGQQFTFHGKKLQHGYTKQNGPQPMLPPYRFKMFFIARQYCRYRQKWIKNVSTKTIRLELAESCTLIYWACFCCWKKKEKKKSPKKQERSRATLETAMKSCWHWLATNRAERRRTEASVAKGRGGYWSVKPWQRD